jgi:tetratricopeptide (TPR) repeat protein
MKTSSQTANSCLEYLCALWERGWVKGLLLVVAVIFAYQPAWHAGFIWDDDAYVTQNKLLTAPDGLKRIWFSLDSPSQYFPLTYTAFRVERAFWGLNPVGYHWVNILLHAANALLVWRLLKRLGVPGSWLAAGIFALHPVQVESVAWITERKNVLSLFFYLLALLCWVEFVAERPRRLWRFYLLALIFHALALFGKTTACTLPAALFLVLWLQRQPIKWFRLAQIIPFLVLGVGMGLLTMWWERHMGTEGKFFGLGLPERLLIATHAVWFYLGKLVWPVNLTFSYPRWTINAADPLAYGWLLAGLGLGVVIYLARRFTGRGVEVAALFYVATLIPLLGFIMLYTFNFSFVADHYQYVASIGPIALAVGGIATALGFWGKGKRFLKPALYVALLLTLGVLTWRQCGMYADVETLWRATLARNPNCWMAHHNLGYALAQKGQWDEAIEQYQKDLAIRPQHAMAHDNLGIALAQKGRTDEAIAHFQKALEIQPDYAEAHDNLGNVLLKKDRVDEAITQYQMALQIKPDNAKAHNNLGNALLKKGRVDEAITRYQTALQIQPDYAEAHANLGNALCQKGRMNEAITHYQKALQIKPDSPQVLNNLAWLLATCPDAHIRDGVQAVKYAGHACELTHYGAAPIVGTLAAACAEAGRYDDAIAAAQKACALATAAGEQELLEKNQKLLVLYRARQPYRETAEKIIPAAP